MNEVAAWQRIAAPRVRVDLPRDPQHEDCKLAQDGWPDSTLACAECGRALWVHATRHDTCPQFCWVTEQSITDRQIGQLATVADIPDEVRLACGRSLSDFLLAPPDIREARQTCATVINNAKHAARKVSP
jgi:hypothetical protein